MIFNDGEIYDAFKTPIYRVVGKDIDTPKLLEFGLSRKKSERSVVNSNIGGWHSGELLDCPEVQDLKNFILDHAKKFAPELGTQVSKIVSMWMMINGHKHYNREHAHAGCKIRGVFYIKTPPNSGNIYFLNPSGEMARWAFGTDYRPNAYVSDCYQPSIEKFMYMFPSWLVHSVDPNLNENDERVAISFNIN